MDRQHRIAAGRRLVAGCGPIMAVVVAVGVAGCAPNKQPTQVGKQADPSTTQPSEAQIAAQMHGRVTGLQASTGELDNVVGQLPGRNEQEQRQLVGTCFEHLDKILTLLEGPSPSGEFRQGIRTLQSSRTQLGTGSMDLAAEPTIGQGIRATYSVLEEIARNQFAGNEEITKGLDAFRQQRDALDTVRGPLHRVAAAQALQSALPVIHKMSSELANRAGEGAPEPSAPATPTPPAAKTE